MDEKQNETSDDQAYTTADYLPANHQMNNPDCTCSACQYPTN